MSTVSDIHAEYTELGSLNSVLHAFVESDFYRKIDFAGFCREEMKKKEAEQQPWEIALNQIRAHANEILSKHFQAYNAIYSAYKDDVNGVAIDNLDEVAIDENDVTVAYGTLSGNGDVYETQKLDRPTWGELLVEFEKAIRFTGDYHHIFLESVSWSDERGQWIMWSGS